ncbi:MAG TPA: Mrp/NBP35 family ATP-binding protein [Candidatus Bathyarchaeia archaeon]|nr:Mrp/NBP35 family ATP-binding protein [Candidatus Bathyarchaeia archaeon]
MSTQANERSLDNPRQQLLEQQQALRRRMAKIKHKVAVISGKGGVGKSTVTVNLAAAFAKTGHVVGVLDADIHGPSVPRLLGLTGQQMKVGPPGAFPVPGPLGIKVVSIDFFLPEERTPTIWRGPLKMRAIRQFLTDIVWGDLDVLFIDLPPGTGDEALSIAQLLPEIDGVVIVTMPSELSRAVVKKAITFAERMGLPIIGIVENMSGFVCPTCGDRIEIFQSGGGRRMAEETGVVFLGGIPIDPKVGVASDKGSPFVIENPDSPATKAFLEIVEKVEAYLKMKEQKKSVLAVN